MSKSLTKSFKLTSKQWLIILASNILAYCCLIMPGINVPEFLTFDDNRPSLVAGCFQILVVAIFLIIQIIGVQLATSKKWHLLFHWPRPKEWAWALIFLLVTYIISVLSGVISQKLFGSVSSNAAAGLTISTPHFWLIFLYQRFSSAIQIMGEEFLAIMPLLAIIQGAKAAKLPKPVWWGNIGSALIFALLHLSTYDYNLGYVILGLAFTRIALNWAFIKTNNMWVSFLVHFLFDSIAFLLLAVAGK